MSASRLSVPKDLVHLSAFLNDEVMPSAVATHLFSRAFMASCTFLLTSFEVDDNSLGALLNGLISNASVERALALKLRQTASSCIDFALATAARSAELRHLTALRVAINGSDVGTMVMLAKQLKGLRRLDLDVHHSTDRVRRSLGFSFV
jgi:hypothetical protein